MKKYIICIIWLCSFGLSLCCGALAEDKQNGQPLIYEYNIKGPVSIESEMVTTAGLIKTISAFWEFEGEVFLDASANGGFSYSRITNGLPFSEGFIPGNKLRFRINISKDGILEKLIVGYADNSGVTKAFQNPELASFKFSKQIRISGGNRELFNYPVKVRIEKDLLGKKNVESDFRDVRFTASDERTPLNYYLEGLFSSKGAVSKDAIFWVKIPQLPKEGLTIYLYYGNKETVSVSNPEAVFLFFDDFSTFSLDKEKWLMRSELKSQPFTKEGFLILRDNSIISRKFKIKEGILEFKARVEENTAIQGIVHGSFSSETLFPIEEAVYSSGFLGAEHTIAINDVVKLNIGNPIKPLTEYIYKVIVNGGGIIFERSDENYEKQAEIRFLDTYKLEKGYIGLKATSAPFGAGSAYFDWVRVRPYVDVEPKAEIK